MTFHLIVRHPFGDHDRGDRITDPEEVARLSDTGSDHVVRVAAPDPPQAD